MWASHGNGLPPAWNMLRANQKPPVATIEASQISAVRRRKPRARTMTPTVSAAIAAAVVSFVPIASPAARPATIRAPVRPPLAPALRVEQDRGGREQQRDGGDVVGRVAGLARDHRVRVEDGGDREQRQRRGAEGPADAPGREQGEAEPAEVDQRREQVVVEEHDPGRVQELGVLRVEPVQVLGVGEVESVDRALLGEPRRERRVVPHRVEAVHARRPARLHAGRPMGDDEDAIATEPKVIQAGDHPARPWPLRERPCQLPRSRRFGAARSPPPQRRPRPSRPGAVARTRAGRRSRGAAARR